MYKSFNLIRFREGEKLIFNKARVVAEVEKVKHINKKKIKIKTTRKIYEYRYLFF